MGKINQFENNAHKLNINIHDFARIDMNVIQTNLLNAKNYLEQPFVSGDIAETYNDEIIHNPSSLCKSTNHIMHDERDCSDKVKNITDVMLNTSIIKEK